MLGELQALPLVVGLEVAAVQDLRHLGDPLVDQAADDLAVLQDEGNLVAAHLTSYRFLLAFLAGVLREVRLEDGTATFPFPAELLFTDGRVA